MSKYQRHISSLQRDKKNQRLNTDKHIIKTECYLTCEVLAFLGMTFPGHSIYKSLKGERDPQNLRATVVDKTRKPQLKIQDFDLF